MKLLSHFALGVACVGFISFQPACSNSPPRSDEGSQEAPAVSVQVASAHVVPFAASYEVAGTVRAAETAAIASKVMGTISQVSVKAGDPVKAGQLLLEIDTALLKSGVAEAEAAVAAADNGITEAERAQESATAEAKLASQTYERYKQLLDRNSVSQHEFDQVETRRSSADAAQRMAGARLEAARAHREQATAVLESARTQLSYTRVSAPSGGVVTARAVDPGDLATIGATLLTIENSSAYRLEAALPESRLQALKVGEEATISIPAAQLHGTGRVVEIEPSADIGSRTYLVKISLPAKAGVRTGMFGRALFSLETVDVLAVPSQAVLRDGQLTSVFVIFEGHARRRLVTVGRISGNLVEVLSGLEPGEQVAVSGIDGLTDGSPTEMRP